MLDVCCTEEGEFEKQQKAIEAAIGKAAKKGDNKLLKSIQKEKENAPKKRKTDRMLHMLFREMTEQLEDSDMDFNEAIDSFAEAAKEVNKAGTN